MKKLSLKLLLFLGVSLTLLSCSYTNNSQFEKWSLEFNEEFNSLSILHQDQDILKQVVSKYSINNQFISTSEYPNLNRKEYDLIDSIGRGRKIIYTYSGLDGYPKIEQIFCFYEGQPYFLVEAQLVSNDSIASNYIAPIYTEERNEFLEKDSSNRVLTVPFDNDSFVPYLSSPLVVEDTSSEVTAIFNGAKRQGLIVGSVEHDTWKTGIYFSTSENSVINKFEIFGGLANEMTRDISTLGDRPSCEHGYLKGKIVKSPKLFFGYYEDWRRGLESYGEICAKIAPPRKWEKGTPFGWNSWAAMAEKVNFVGAIDVSNFFQTDMQTNNFSNDSTVYIGLDSFWDNFTTDQLRKFVNHCHQNGQKAGIYWCPFSDWHGNADAYVEGTDNEWKYKDIYLYASNGKPRKIESLAVDPTHPGTKKRIKYYMNMFKDLGYEYVKLDFINNGTLEAASFYNPKVTTGKQAYNEGMSYLTEVCGDDVFLALSIAPTFPAQYGTSKRISCDAWGAMTEGDIGTTGYMLNSLSFGWWLNRVYPFNDADHILLYQPDESEDYQLGANRSRITSAVITGIYMLGDNFSLKGSIKGDNEARRRAREVATNIEINDIARLGQSFYPVEGYLASAPNKPETQFMLQTEECVYLAVFNFNKKENLNGSVDFERLGIDSTVSLSVKELWTSEFSMSEDKKIHYNVPPQDVRIYKIQNNN